MEFGGKGNHEDINSAPTYPMERSGLRAGARPLGGTHTQAPGFRVLPHSPTPTPTQRVSSSRGENRVFSVPCTFSEVLGSTLHPVEYSVPFV